MTDSGDRKRGTVTDNDRTRGERGGDTDVSIPGSDAKWEDAPVSITHSRERACSPIVWNWFSRACWSHEAVEDAGDGGAAMGAGLP